MLNGTDSPARTGDPQIHNLPLHFVVADNFCKPGQIPGLSNQILGESLQTTFAAQIAVREVAQ